jgi:ATP-binding cassette, subfamily B, bacterial PglK
MIFTKLWSLLDFSYRFRLLNLLLATIIITILEMLSIGMIIPITYFFFNTNGNDYLFVQYFFNFVEIVSEKFNQETIIILFIIVVIIFFIKFIFQTIFVFYQAKFNADLQVFISKQMLDKFSSFKYSDYTKNNSSDLLRNINNEVNVLANNVSMPILQIITEFFIIFGMIILLFFVNILVTLITSFIFLFFGYLLLTSTKKVLVLAGEERQKFDGLRIKILNIIHGGFKEIKVLNKLNYFIQKYNLSNKKFAYSYKKQIALSQFPRFLLEILTVISLLILVIILMLRDHSNIEIITFLSIFAGCAFKIMPAANRIIRSLQMLKFGKSSIEIILNFLLKKNSASMSSNKSLNNNNDTFFEIKNLNFSYDNKRNDFQFENLNLKLKKNDAIGIIGPSGSGKSTLVNFVLGLETTNSGTIETFGKSIHDDIFSWRSKIGYVPQDIFLFEESIKENIALGVNKNEINDQKIFDVLKKVQLKEFIMNLNDGINTPVSERGLNLSGGQKQRLGIARALYNNPEILIFDEATSALNAEIEDEIIDQIYQLKENVTLIIITHKPSILKNCNKIYKMINGHLLIEKE